MNLSKVNIEKFDNELRNIKVYVSLSDTQINGCPMLVVPSFKVTIAEKKPDELIKDGEVVGIVKYNYIPFKITINDKFHHDQDSIFFRNNKYTAHLQKFIQGVIDEVDANIKLRLSKWEILDFLTMLKTRLRIIRGGFTEIPNNCPGKSGKVYNNFNAQISSNKYEDLMMTDTIDWVNFVLSHYWDLHMKSIDAIEEYINIREGIIEKSEDYVKATANIPVDYNSITWNKSDTDLLELITALLESGSIQNQTKDLSRKEAIEMFSQFFNIEIKDAESKLTRATNRKKDISQYLTSLKNTFEDYAKGKEDRLDFLRK